MSAPALTSTRTPLLTVADLRTLRARHLANAVECWRHADRHRPGSDPHEVWASRAIQHGNWARQLRVIADHRTRTGTAPAGEVFPR
ncbi:hypothetical protein [Pseudonocardia sp. NPDC049635]|uniref:hypothetical protein n=1 Tax=Pseudonocardia sp. NPDC049635 TaxID=3155506 RepID=UPI0033DD8C3D